MVCGTYCRRLEALVAGGRAGPVGASRVIVLSVVDLGSAFA